MREFRIRRCGARISTVPSGESTRVRRNGAGRPSPPTMAPLGLIGPIESPGLRSPRGGGEGALQGGRGRRGAVVGVGGEALSDVFPQYM